MMSTVDVTFYECEPMTVPARFPIASLAVPQAALAGFAARLVAWFEHRLTMGRMARFSDHRLRDLGFERDWDGSIIQPRR